MTYYDSAEGEVISRERARQEIEKHDACWLDFVQDVGLCDAYFAQEVLDWLGY